MSDDYTTEGNVVKDNLYVRNVEYGGDEYDPRQDVDENEPVDLKPNPVEPRKLRDSTYDISRNEGYYAEDEDYETGGDIPDRGDKDDKESSRQLSSLVAASHREGRAAEDKRKSALKASELHEKVTGQPLVINERGEVLEDK